MLPVIESGHRGRETDLVQALLRDKMPGRIGRQNMAMILALPAGELQ